VKAELV
jgi:hypothetical protein